MVTEPNNPFFYDEEKTISILINGVEYLVSNFF